MFRPHKTIWTYVQDPNTVTGQQAGDTCFNPVTGEGHVYDGINSIWNPFRLTNTAGVGTAGYHLGGIKSLVRTDEINKLLFSDESLSVLASTLTTARNTNAKGVQSYEAGFTAGGFCDGDTWLNTLSAIRFSNEVPSVLLSTLSVSKTAMAGLSSVSCGYFVGGDNLTASIINPSVVFASIERLDFVSRDVSLASYTLDRTRTESAGVNNNQRGYLMQGFYSESTNVLRDRSTVDRLTFTTETVSSLATILSGFGKVDGGMSSPVRGYVSGGYTFEGASYSTNTARITFSDESLASLGATFDGRFHCGVSSSYVKGYEIGGETSSGSLNTNMRMIYATEIASSISQTLATICNGAAGVSNPN